MLTHIKNLALPSNLTKLPMKQVYQGKTMSFHSQFLTRSMLPLWARRRLTLPSVLVATSSLAHTPADVGTSLTSMIALADIGLRIDSASNAPNRSGSADAEASSCHLRRYKSKLALSGGETARLRCCGGRSRGPRQRDAAHNSEGVFEALARSHPADRRSMPTT